MTYKRILVPVDGMASSVASILDAMCDNGNRILKSAARTARGKGFRANTVLVESFGTCVADAIVRQAKRCRADIIVMGTHGRRGINRLVMGSDAELVVRHAGIPVLLVRGRAPAKATAGGKKRN